MPLPRLHRAVDHLAMWSEDLRRLAPAPFVRAAGVPLDCFGPLPPLPASAPGADVWRARSPRPAPGDVSMIVFRTAPVGPSRGTVVLVPPWKLPRLTVLSGWRARLARAGLEVWTLVPPRHLERAAAGRRSGEGFVTPDLPALRAVFEQLVTELRLLVALARRDRGGEVSMVGLSLGGLAALLAATAPEPLDAAIAIAPPADLAAVFASTRIGRRYLRLARRAGAPAPPAAELEDLLAPFAPTRRRPTAGRVLVAVGAEDRIALPGPALALAATWGAEARSFPRGHLTLLFACDGVRREAVRLALDGGRDPAPARSAPDAAAPRGAHCTLRSP
jgi:pimeloyl-ACP methyl ester carboxylesterase